MKSGSIAALAFTLAARGLALTITVTSVVDDTTPGNCSLREAVRAAETNLAVDACPAGSPVAADIVQLAAANYTLLRGEITVAGGGPLILRGSPSSPGSVVRGSSGNPDRLLSLANAPVTFESLSLELGSHGNSGGAVRADDIDLVMRDVSLAFNIAPLGGGLYYDAFGTHALTIERCQFSGNEAANGTSEAQGGGASIFLGGSATARIVDSTFEANAASSTSTASNAAGGGLQASASDAARIFIDRTLFLANRLDPAPSGGAEGSGANLVASGATAVVVVRDSAFENNDVVQPSATELTGALHAFGANGAVLLLDRVRLEDNDAGEPGRHLVLGAFGNSPILATNLLLANGPAIGLDVACADAACRIGHATITGHATWACFLTAFGAGELSLDNSILWQNGGVGGGGAVFIGPTNLTGAVDPEFVAPGNGDYALGPASPAIDFGDATVSSVGPYDLAHAPRVVGLDTDAGAFERGALFGDGFESGDPGAWSASVP